MAVDEPPYLCGFLAVTSTMASQNLTSASRWTESCQCVGRGGGGVDEKTRVARERREGPCVDMVGRRRLEIVD